MRPMVGLARLRDEEHGAVLMIAALCLLVFLGMLVLTVDLGRGVAYKRQVVNGTDAAALAAAQQCALGNGDVAARAAAASALDQNVDLGVAITNIQLPECNTPGGSEMKTVTVSTNADIDYFFAPIFGIGSGDIAGRAVAIWGVVAQGHPVPISVDISQLADCQIYPDDTPDVDTQCHLDYPKDTLTNPRWGLLDFGNWGNASAAPCSVSASDLSNTIANGGWSNALPAPAFDCLDNGLSHSVWKTMEGMVLTFPVIDIQKSTGETKPGNADCTGADIPALEAAGKDCQLDTAWVVGWISLRVDFVGKKSSDLFLETTFLGPTTGNGIPGSDVEDFGLRAIRLVD
jgi:Flp pilus assembly protein TadG